MKIKNGRSNLIFVFILVFPFAIISRLFFLQVLKGDYYKAQSQGLYSSFNETQGERGEIFFKNKESAAININYSFVFASPKEIKNVDATSELLRETLNLDKNYILEKLKSDGSYSLIKRKLNQEEIENLKKLKLEGIYVGTEPGRYYPQENLASQVIGFFGAEGKGQYGLEEFFDEVLGGEKGFGKTQKGNDLVLTIDYNVQFEAEKLLNKARENIEFEKGEIIVMEPNSGKILAMANVPNFNSNKYEDYAKEGNLEIFKNQSTQELFEPGSVFKPITIAGALEEEKITPKTTYIDEGFVKIGGSTISNYDQRIYGEQTITNVLEKSINTGAVFVERQLGHNLFLKYVEKFGFFEPTGIDIKETYSENKEIKKGREINFATASFGQGIGITTIQLARAYCAIANNGRLVKPSLVDNYQISDSSNETSQVISSKTAAQLTAMLVSVVENGFGKAAGVPGYYIAGKTGTAQIAFSALGIDKPSYSDKTIQSFVGFFPAFEPKILILVKLYNPKTKTAEYSAVPIFHDLAEYIIHFYQIPPDYE